MLPLSSKPKSFRCFLSVPFYLLLKLHYSFPTMHLQFCYPIQSTWHLCMAINFCQLMVVGTSSTPTGIPSLAWGEERNFIQCKRLNCDMAGRTAQQFKYETAQPALLWSGHLLRSVQLPSTPVCSALLCSALGRELQWFSWGNAVFILQWKRKVPSPSHRELTYINTSPSPWSQIGLSSCEWGLQILAVWRVQKSTVLSCPELVCEDAAVQGWWDRESFTPVGWNVIPGTPL